MEAISPILALLIIVFSILQIILFFKIWGMTNDSRAIRKHLDKSEKRYFLAHHPEYPGWAEDVTEDEKVDALDFIQSLRTNQVIVMVFDTKIMECWGEDYWKSVERSKEAKLIYKLPQ